MPTNFTLKPSIIRKTTLAFAALVFFQLAVNAQSREEPPEITVEGQTALFSLKSGEMMHFTAFNPRETDNGRPNEPITLRLRVYDSHGAVIAESAKVVIPPGEFRSIDFDHAELTTGGDSSASRNTVRTIPLWGVRSRSRIHVSSTLELIDNNTGAGTFKFFFTVEALP